MKKLILVLLFIPFALAINQNWQYVQDIAISGGDQPVKLALSPEILEHAQFDGRDFRITESGEEIPYKLFLESYDSQKQTISAISASSHRDDFRGISYVPENVFDGVYSHTESSYFQIDGAVDQTNSWLIVDLGSTKLTSRAKFTSSGPTFSKIQVEGSENGNTWTLLKGPTYTSSTVSYTPSTFRYLRFTFWHSGDMVIDELDLFGESSGYILFFAVNGLDYKLYYGNSLATAPSYDLSDLFLTATTPSVYTQGEHTNPLYNPDGDGDGVAEDNCPYVPNQDQLDSDGDGVGDLCDNCQLVGNAGQQDSDSDGFGNSCDNCQYVYNPNQLDRDLDGVGWVCDDLDNDGILNPSDNCVEGSNRDQADSNDDGVGDVCDDSDGDGIPNYADNCAIANEDQLDSDGDGVGNSCDNCPDTANANQRDVDRDGIGDVCDQEESRLLENKNFVWGILVLAILVIAGLAFAMYKPVKKDEQ